jgi:hypothetical protein
MLSFKRSLNRPMGERSRFQTATYTRNLFAGFVNGKRSSDKIC